MTLIESYLPSLLLAFGLGLGLWVIHWVLLGRHRDLGNERKFPRQLLLLVLSVIVVLAVTLVLPIDESSRNRLFGLIGLLVSGTIAFSSTNLLANLMGGILLRTTKSFRIGNFEKQQLVQEIQELETSLKDPGDEEKAAVKARLEAARNRLKTSIEPLSVSGMSRHLRFAWRRHGLKWFGFFQTDMLGLKPSTGNKEVRGLGTSSHTMASDTE